MGRQYKIGHSLDPATQIGPIVSATQYERVCGYLDLGPREGAEVMLGGSPLTDGDFAKGFYVAPTILARVRDEMRVAREEIFGPVGCVMPFDTVGEVIARANATSFGLAGAVWTRDISRAMTVARAVRAGTIWINHYHTMDPGVPFGGYKMSGYGREGSFDHVESYLETKSVWIRTDA